MHILSWKILYCFSQWLLPKSTFQILCYCLGTSSTFLCSPGSKGKNNRRIKAAEGLIMVLFCQYTASMLHLLPPHSNSKLLARTLLCSGLSSSPLPVFFTLTPSRLCLPTLCNLIPYRTVNFRSVWIKFWMAPVIKDMTFHLHVKRFFLISLKCGTYFLAECI